LRRNAYNNETRFNVTPDTILPHPYSMSLAVTIFARPVGKPTGHKSYHAVYGPQL
jgi:hypothetical protein